MAATSADLSSALVAHLQHHRVLAQLIKSELIETAIREEGLDQDDDQEALGAYAQSQGFDPANAEAWAAHCAERGLTQEELRWHLQLRSRTASLAMQRYGHQTESLFLKRKMSLDRVVYNLIRVKDRYLARELYFRLDAGEQTFSELASAHSEGAENITSGVVGPVPLTQAHPILVEKLRTSKPGQLLEPFRILDWWLVVRLEHHIPATFNEGVAAELANELLEEWLREEVASKMSRLTGQA
jgi:parvulin-like peptidyl-prolyl isomerase